MRLLLIGSLLLSGGGAAAMQNETVNEEVSNVYNRVRYQVRKQMQKNLIEQVKESGFPYPPQDYLDTLTDEQEAVIVTTIDQINADYDWLSMTDEEIVDTLKVVKDELKTVYDDLGIDAPNIRAKIRDRINQRSKQRIVENVKENGIAYPAEDILAELTEEQAQAVTDLIDSYNDTYDWATMTNEDIVDALTLFKDDVETLKDDLGIDIPLVKSPRERFWDHAKERYVDYVQENGIPYPKDEFLANLTEEQALAVTDLIDEYNTTYDWATMTDEDVLDALALFRTDMNELKDVLDIDVPFEHHPHPRFGHRHSDNEDNTTPDSTPDSTPDETDEA